MILMSMSTLGDITRLYNEILITYDLCFYTVKFFMGVLGLKMTVFFLQFTPPGCKVILCYCSGTSVLGSGFR